MRLYQYCDPGYYYVGKIHVVKKQIISCGTFLCGRIFANHIDKGDPNDMDFSKGICKHCIKICKKEYKVDLKFEVIKLKLGIKI